MHSLYNDLLLQILSIMRYRDKETFAKNFVEMNHLEAMTNCIEKFPASQKQAITAKPADPEEMGKYISKETYQEEYKRVSVQALFEFLQHMDSVLVADQKEQILQVIAAFQ